MMSKKNLIIITIFLFTIIFGWLLFNYFSNTTTTTSTQTQTTTEFPFGNTTTTNENGVSNTGDNEQGFSTTNNNNGNGGGGYSNSKIKQIYLKPTSGLNIPTNKNDAVRFVDRATGNIYEYNINKQGESERITNTTIAKIQETSWSKNGENLILKFLDEESNINNFSGKIKISTSTEGTVGEVLGIFLTKNLIQSAINPTGDKVFELIKKVGDSGSYGILSSSNGENKKQIFDSPLSLFNISWVNENIITFTTKPSYKDTGFVSFFNIKNNSLDKIFGSIKGLTTNTNESADFIAYSENINKGPLLNIYNIGKKEHTKINIKTLSDKCVWSKLNSKHLYCAVPKNIQTGNYPDGWYQGLISFNDNFWMIDVEDGTTKIIYESKEEDNLNLDAFDLKISGDDKYIALTNKNDLSVWLLDLSENIPTE